MTPGMQIEPLSLYRNRTHCCVPHDIGNGKLADRSRAPGEAGA